MWDVLGDVPEAGVLLQCQQMVPLTKDRKYKDKKKKIFKCIRINAQIRKWKTRDNACQLSR